jgi:hypothetical protein
MSPPCDFAEQSYSVYRTAGGCRVLCTSMPFPWTTHHEWALRFMKFLGADPQYMELCGKQKCYRARLTPKPWRDRGHYGITCRIVSHRGASAGGCHPDLLLQANLHGVMTGAAFVDSEGEEVYLA